MLSQLAFFFILEHILLSSMKEKAAKQGLSSGLEAVFFIRYRGSIGNNHEFIEAIIELSRILDVEISYLTCLSMKG